MSLPYFVNIKKHLRFIVISAFLLLVSVISFVYFTRDQGLIKKAKNDTYEYTSKDTNGVERITFSKLPSISVQKGDAAFDFTFIGKKSQQELKNIKRKIENNRLIYENVLPQTNIIYTIQGNNYIKEDIEITKKPEIKDDEQLTYLYDIKISNLTYTTQTDGSISPEFIDNKGNRVIIPQLMMTDAKGSTSEDLNMYIYLKDPNDPNFFRAELTPSKEWLLSEEREYPIKVDPSLSWNQANWWDQSYGYRQTVSITNSSGSNLTNFQVSFTLDTATLITAGKMQSDCDDIRITDISGNLLNYWIEENNPGCNNSATKIWVNNPTIPTSGNSIYVYYGNSNSSSYQSGKKVFDFFDDFNAGLDSSVWSATSTPSVSSGELTITTGSVYSKSPVVTTSQNYIYESRVKWTTTTGGLSGIHIGGDQSIAGSNSGSDKLIMLMTTASANYLVTGWAADGTVATYNLVNNASQYTATANTYHVSGFSMDTSNIRYYKDRVKMPAAPADYPGTWSAAPYMYLGSFYGSTASTTDIKDMTIDWVLSRKFIATEPTAAAPANEEKSPAPVGYWKFDEGAGVVASDSVWKKSGTVTNLITNPSFELNDTNWFFSDATGGAHASSTENTVVGSKSMKVTVASSGDQYHLIGTQNLGSIAGQTFTASAFVDPATSTGGVTLGLYWKGISGNWISSGNVFSNTIYGDGQGYRRLSATGAAPAGAYYVVVIIITGAENAVGYYYTDGFQIESSSASNLYCDGSLTGNGSHAWTGTAHASTSVCDTGTDGELSNNPTWRNEDMCVSGKCLSFDGIDDYVDMGDAFYSDALTVCTWIKPSQMGTAKTIVAKRNSAGPTAGLVEWGFYITDNLVYWASTNSSNQEAILLYSSKSIPMNSWSYVCAVQGGNGQPSYIYQNGVQVSTANQTSIMRNTNSRIQIAGRTNNNDTRYFNGFIDETKIYDYARNSDQIKQDYIARGGLKGVQAQFAAPVNKSGTMLAQGLVGYWKMDEASWNGTTGEVIDASGDGNNGTSANGATTGAGKYGNGGGFDGIDDFVNVGTGSDLNISSNSITVSAWVKANSIGSNSVGIVSKGKTGVTPQQGYALGTLSTGTKMRFYPMGPQSDYVEATSTISTGQWVHYLGTYDGSNIKMYINGQLDASAPSSASMITSDGPLVIGRWYGNYDGYYFNGAIDEVRIYNRALSEGEVRSLYDFAPGPVLYFPLDENAGNALVSDRSGNKITGLLYGSMTGSQWSDGKIGSSLNIDGLDDYIQASLNPKLDFAGPFTISSWVQMDDANTDINLNQYVINKGSGTNGDATKNSYSLQLSNTGTSTPDYVSCVVSNGTTLYNTSSVPGTYLSSFSPNIWYHLTCQYDGANIKIFVNGVMITSTAFTGTVNILPNANFRVGVLGDLSRLFDGKVDEVKAYNYARTPAQIVEDMNSGHPAPGSPVGSAIAYYKFDEGYGDIANNSGNSGSSINGDLYGTCPGSTTCPTWINDGKFGKAVRFDGVDDYITVPDVDYFSPSFNDMTISFWMNGDTDADCTNSCYIITKGTVSNWEWSARTTTSASTGKKYFNFIAWTPGGGNVLSNSYETLAVLDGTWHHYLITLDNINSYYNLYIDGKKAVSNVAFSSATMANGTTPVRFGARYSGSGGLLNGDLDEVKIYNFALTEDQAKLEYNQGKSQVLGSQGTNSDGKTSSWSSASEYCIPGDTSSCVSPVAEWKLDENSGTSVYSTSGNLSAGTLGVGSSAPIWVLGNKGSALDFDGVQDYVSIANSSANLSGDFTLSLWVYPRDDSENPRWFSLIDGTNNLQVGHISTDYVYFRFGGSTQLTSSVIGLNMWHHAVFVNQGGTKYIYIDGVKQTTSSGGVTSNATYSAIGGGLSGFTTNGMLDEIKIYNYARTPSQIAWDYNRGSPVAWYKMDECQGTTIYNSAKDGNSNAMGNNGTLTIGGSGNNTVVGTCATNPSAWYSGKDGKISSSMSFDGTDDYISIPDNDLIDFASDQDFTVAFWTKPSTTNPATAPAIVEKWSQTAGYPYVFRLANSMSAFQFARYDGTNNPSVFYTATILDRWYHVAGLKKGSTLYLYVDGKLIGTTTDTTSGTTTNASALCLGQRCNGVARYNGLVDDLRIYNYPLTEAQIETVYNNGAVSFK